MRDSKSFVNYKEIDLSLVRMDPVNDLMAVFSVVSSNEVMMRLAGSSV